MANINNGGGKSNAETEIGSLSIEGLSGPTTSGGVKNVTHTSCTSVYLGETLKYDVVVRRCPTMDASLWTKQVSRMVSQAVILPCSNLVSEALPGHKITGSPVIIVENNEDETAPNGLLCHILATFVGNSNTGSSNEDSSCKPFFRDEDTYVIPMSSHLHDVPEDCHFVQLKVVLSLYRVAITRSDTSPELEASKIPSVVEAGDTEEEGIFLKKKIPVDIHGLFSGDYGDQEAVRGTAGNLSLDLSPVRVSSSYRSVQEKTVTARLRVQGPPELRMRHSSAGQKQLILLAVNNKTEKQMVIKNIQMLTSSSPVYDSLVNDEGSSVKWETCHQVINLESPRRSHAFPVILSSCEELNLIYRLHLSSVPTDSELSLRANVKWTHAGASNEITTVYKIPRIKVRCPPFIVTVKCNEEAELSKTFSVTYTISNQLHDFMSMRLYYNLDNMCRALTEQGGSEEEVSRVQHLRDSVVCHDPDTAISSCPRGSCVPIRVGFLIHKPGLYELSELMKVNLRYSLLETQLSPVPDDRESHSTSSGDTNISFQSTDDHLFASEELWRGRSGSTASLATPVIFQSAEERRRSFAAKSYSFGDLGPTVSADSDEAVNLRNKGHIKRSSAVPPPRPPPPRMFSQTERELIRPSNFLKQPFYIYISDPLIT
ncbi:hypothetical protein BsWGS_03577 [Bradybaena similaris]